MGSKKTQNRFHISQMVEIFCGPAQMRNGRAAAVAPGAKSLL
jgi:hypothetical protein